MLPRSFQKAIQAIKNLEGNPRYIGAFIFGSVARGEVTKNSDLDVKVITGETTTCENINHPLIGGVKLDITFLSFGKLKQQMVLEEKTGRIPMIAESIIVFDTNNILSSLKQAKLKVQPRKFSKSDYQNQQFFIYHADDKVRRNLEEDPDSALLGMHVGIQELIKIHYELHGHWKVSSKRLLKDLDSWDKVFSDLLRLFVRTQDVQEKFVIWTQIIDHIASPMGGRMNIEDSLCDCEDCKIDLANLAK